MLNVAFARSFVALSTISVVRQTAEAFKLLKQNLTKKVTWMTQVDDCFLAESVGRKTS